MPRHVALVGETGGKRSLGKAEPCPHLPAHAIGASFARLLRDPVRSRIANIAFALALVASVLLPMLR